MTSVWLVTNGGSGEDGDEWLLFDIYATEQAANARVAEENARRGFMEFEVEEWGVEGECQVPQQENLTLTDEEREAIGWYAAFGSGGRVATLRSLLGRLSPRSYGETTEKRCIVNTISKKTSNFYEQDSVILVDPPQGWKFGFPKRWDRAKHPDCREWMISEGYPREMAELNLPCTFTSVTDEC